MNLLLKHGATSMRLKRALPLHFKSSSVSHPGLLIRSRFCENVDERKQFQYCYEPFNPKGRGLGLKLDVRKNSNIQSSLLHFREVTSDLEAPPLVYKVSDLVI